MTTHPSPTPGQPVILLVGPEDEFGYLLARYAGQSRRPMRVRRTDVLPEPFVPGGVALVWLQSLDDLAEARSRDRGPANSDTPVVVMASASEADRAAELGADHCAQHPLTYLGFQAALASVGLLDDEEL